MTASSLTLLVALVVALAAFVIQRHGLRFTEVPKPIAPPRGSAAAGVIYAFTKAFAPTAKESASLHLLSYLAGIVYHLAIFAALARLAASVLPVAVPLAANTTLAVMFTLGLACGLALLAKRTVDARVRGISVPDDFLANLLVDAVLAAALAASLHPGLVPLFRVIGALLLLYAPLGKLRHMLFLLTSRSWSGAYFGRRGVRPNPDGPGMPHG
jgi:hypothetical protein